MEIKVPKQVAREIHLRIEAERHPITFYQKLQPNYQDFRIERGIEIGPTLNSTTAIRGGTQPRLWRGVSRHTQ